MAPRAGAARAGGAQGLTVAAGATTAPAGHTYAFRHLPLPRALDALCALGFTSVELWLGHVGGAPDAAAAALAERGLTAVAVGAGGFYERGGASPEEAVETLAVVGCAILVACVSPRRLPEVASLLPPDVTLCVENHWDQALATPVEIVRELERQTCPVAACLDTGHALAAGVRPDTFARALDRHLGHVHLKDARLTALPERLLGRRLRRRLLSRPRPVAPGSGGLDLARLASALHDIGFSGAVTVEHDGPEPERALAALRENWTTLSADATTAGLRRG